MVNRPVKKEYGKNGKRLFTYTEALEIYCDYLERLLKQEDIEPNPCKGCTDYCYKANECKSNGGCAND